MFSSVENTKRQKIAGTVILFIYSILTLAGALNHELWIDEAQAWNIARDNSIAGIIDVMKYEGHPPLWHFILYVFSHLGFSWRMLPFISWAFNVLTAAIIIYKFPFNMILKAVIVFSAGFLFFNSVMSRVYCIIPFLLCCIVLLYPKRKQYSILYGIMVGLLANTHIMMCGMVGALGILMLIDFIKDCRINTFKNNTKSILGLLFAGIGVIFLIVAVYGSLSNNMDFANRGLTADSILKGFINGFDNIAFVSLTGFGYNDVMWFSLIALPLKVIFIIMLLLLLKRPRAIFIEALFIIFYIITCETLWITLPNRAAIFIFSFVFTACIAVHEEPKTVKIIHKAKIKSPILTKVSDFFRKIYLKDLKNYSIILCIALAMTVPVGFIYLIQDYCKDFNAWKKAVEYLEESTDENTLIVTYADGNPELSAYMPDKKIYSLVNGEFYTYVSHKGYPAKLDYDEIYNFISDYDKVVFLAGGCDPDYGQWFDNTEYIIREGLNFHANTRYVEIAELDSELLSKLVEEYNKK